MEEEVPFSKEDGEQGSQKNTVGDLHNVQNARIGDNTHNETHNYYSTSQTTLPKELTLNIPKTDPDKLLGRGNDLKELHKLLNNEDGVVVNGLGGIGKTALAQAYAGKYSSSYKHIAWITQTTESIVDDILNTKGLLTTLGVDATGLEPEQLFEKIILKLRSIEEGPNLLVIDNAEQSLSGHRHLLPGQPGWHLLVTSREDLEDFYPKRLGFLSPAEAVELFKQHYTLKVLADEEIRELVDAVDYHTLTIEILAKTAKVQRYSSATLKQAIEQDLRANVKVGRQGGQVEKIGSYLNTVFYLGGLNDKELWLMKQFVCLPSEFHSYELVRELALAQESPYSGSFAETIFGLGQKGWLLYNQETDSYKMHRIIVEVVKKQSEVSLDDVSDLIASITQNLKLNHSDNPVKKFTWVPFGKAILDSFPDSTDEIIGTLQNNLALRLKDLGNYAAAQVLLQKAIQSAEKKFGSEHPTTATRYSNLAMVFQDLGDYARAQALLETSVQSAEKNFGSEHPTTATRYSNLALVLKDLGDYARARILLEKAVQSDEKSFGSDHPTTAIRYSNLAMVLQDLGDYAGARVLQERAVESAEKNLGFDHPTTAIRYSNLALVLLDLGENKGARVLLEKAVQSDERNFGPEHPSTARSYSNLALVLTGLEEFEAALKLSKRALEIVSKIFPEEHPRIATATINYESIKKASSGNTDQEQ